MIYKTFKGEALPALGFGTWHLRGREAVKAIRCALEVGYRHIDTAARYENEDEVGEALAGSGLDRSEIFLTTKVRYTDLQPDKIEQCTRESLARLGVDQVDLLMPHWPPGTDSVGDVMRAFRRVRDKGLTRHIGVSNFTTALLREALDELGDTILTNQVEYHPFLSQKPLMAMLRDHGMALTAAVPLARGRIDEEPVITAIAETHGKSPSQVTLRWLLQQDNVIAIPKSAQNARIRANFQIFDFELSDAETARINALRGNSRIVDLDWAPQWDPAE
jgi:2,5-diketo-D-gluconate reductase B